MSGNYSRILMKIDSLNSYERGWNPHEGFNLYFYFDFVRLSYQICPNCPVKYY